MSNMYKFHILEKIKFKVQVGQNEGKPNMYPNATQFTRMSISRSSVIWWMSTLSFWKAISMLYNFHVFSKTRKLTEVTGKWLTSGRTNLPTAFSHMFKPCVPHVYAMCASCFKSASCAMCASCRVSHVSCVPHVLDALCATCFVLDLDSIKGEVDEEFNHQLSQQINSLSIYFVLHIYK